MQTRLQELDVLRALALLGVIAIHATAWSVPATSAPLSEPLAAIADLARLSVPLFVLASGFALRARHPRGPAERSEFIGRRWRRTLLPWLCWVPVFALLGLADGAIPPSGLGAWLVWGAGHLYFLLLIAQLYLVFLVLPSSRAALAAATAAALALQVAAGWLHTYGPPAPGVLGWPFGALAFWLAPYYCGYFLAGALLADLWPDLREQGWLRPAALAALALCLPLWAWSTTTVPAAPDVHGASAFLWPGRLPLVLAAAVAVLAWGPGAGSALVAWLGGRSLGVYLAHPIFLAVAGPAALALGPAARAAALGAGCLAFGYMTVSLLARTRLGALAIGEPGPVRPAARTRSVARLSTR